VRELLSVTRLLPVFETFDDEHAAVESYQQVPRTEAEPS
jgi:hypothetical protein